MIVNVGSVSAFPNVEPGKEQAMKPLEESAEVYAAWQAWRAHPHASERGWLLEEIADAITALANLAASLGEEDLGGYVAAVERKNGKRGRYE